MKQSEKDNALLGVMLHYCSRLEIACERFKKNYEVFKNDTVFQDSCSLCLIQIGEAVNKLSQDFVDRYPQIDWHRIYGMRCHLVHGYGMFDAEIVWDAIETKIPALREFCEEHFLRS